MRRAELQSTTAAGAGSLDEAAALVELHHTRVTITVGHEDVALRIPADVGLPMERVRPVGTRVLATARRQCQLVERIWTLAENHQQLAVGAELLDHVGALIHGPDIVVLVDPHGMRECKAITARAEFLDERAGL